MQPHLPQFLDPLLAFIEERIPGPLYSILLQVLAHSIALFSGFVNIISTLIEQSPWEINVQDILPPLITILVAYLALLSIYRTTTWLVRTIFFFFKWGTILAALAGGAGYFFGNGGAGAIARDGVITTVGNMVWNALNNQDQYNAGGTRSRKGKPSPKRPTKPSSQRKPQAWDSYNQNRQWQQQEQNPAQTVISNIIEAAGKVARDEGWMDAAKGLFNAGAQTSATQKERPGSKGKGRKDGTTRSR